MLAHFAHSGPEIPAATAPRIPAVPVMTSVPALALNFLAVGLLLALAQPANAAATGGVEPIQSPSLFFSAVRVAGAMAVVIACFFAVVWLFRNWQRLTIRGGRAPRLQVLESKSLGPRHGLYVIGYEQQRFLIASAPTGISMLATLPEGSANEIAAQAAPPQIDFASLLANTLSLRGKPRASSA